MKRKNIWIKDENIVLFSRSSSGICRWWLSFSLHWSTSSNLEKQGYYVSAEKLKKITSFSCFKVSFPWNWMFSQKHKKGEQCAVKRNTKKSTDKQEESRQHQKGYSVSSKALHTQHQSRSRISWKVTTPKRSEWLINVLSTYNENFVKFTLVEKEIEKMLNLDLIWRVFIVIMRI